MAASLLHFPGIHRPIKSNFPHTFRSRSPNPRFSSSFAVAVAAASGGGGTEEERWLREEERWLREERRWLREEQRWAAEREALLREIASLRGRSDAAPQVVRGVPVAAPQAVLAERADVKEMVLEEVRVEDKVERRTLQAVPAERADVKEMVLEEVRVEDKVERRTLRTGSEGKEVKELQEALQKLGFYSGEEDIEYSSFSSGTESAVKTWQASLGIPEDGIMTAELLRKLYLEQEIGIQKTDSWRDGGNGTAVTSIREIAETKQMAVRETGYSEDDLSHPRVYLLGENRWEDPSRLVKRNNPVSGSKSAVSSVTCLSCHGVGRVTCMECDGSGEPNIEPQFLEWVGEDTKCPYCEGLGHTACDACKSTATA